LAYEVDRGQLQRVMPHLENPSEYDYEKLYDYLKQNGFRLDVEEPDMKRYRLLRENIEKGNITVREIIRNETFSGFWYYRKTLIDLYQKSKFSVRFGFGWFGPGTSTIGSIQNCIPLIVNSDLCSSKLIDKYFSDWYRAK
jgi:hypothetical protein